MIIKRAVCAAFAAACLTGIAALPAAHAQGAYATDPGGNSVGLPGPNPGGPGLTPYTGGGTAPGAYYGATQPNYPPPPPSSAGTGNTEAVTNGPQGSPPNWSAQQNVRESEHYTWLLQHNRGFRQARERRECRPITDAQLHQQCLASFAEYSPWAGSVPAYGSSTATGGYGSTSGR